MEGAAAKFLATVSASVVNDEQCVYKGKRMTCENEAIKKYGVRNEWTCKYARGRFLKRKEGNASLLFSPLLSILTAIDSSRPRHRRYPGLWSAAG